MRKTIAEVPCACMSASPLEMILEREAELSAKVDEAVAGAARKVEEAQRSVSAILEEAGDEARKLADEQTGRIASETTTQLDEIERRRKIACDELRRDLEARVPETVEFVTAAVLGDGVTRTEGKGE